MDLNNNYEIQKICPRCGNQVLERRAKCRKCGYSFPMSCLGCGREVIGRLYCAECIDPGVYHWARKE